MQRKNEQLTARVQALEGGSITPEPVLHAAQERAAHGARAGAGGRLHHPGACLVSHSVIVDMQRKNEQLTARVQALEGGSITPEPVL
ncbi:putative restin [Operophtera brumata]|uniref:Putative restin n=1 Tax=Operophtera brumata TaxID=104452 RepID=A0A0L7LN19_OPEBR|nr:putative restin [Operophtera brumata]